MALKAVMDAVNARLAAEWSALPVIELNREGDTPKDGSPYLMVDYPVANSEQVSIGSPGNNFWREEGVFRLRVYAQRGVGVVDGATWADQLAALFRGKLFGGVETFAPASSEIGDDNENGNYYLFSVAVPYRFDLFG